jgi:hypothetical protein
MAESVRRGGAIVSARVDEMHAEAAAAILRHAPGADIASRREAYEREGWRQFEEQEQLELETTTRPTDRFPMVPPLV